MTLTASDEPDEFTGWFKYRNAAISTLGSLPHSAYDEANERAAYRRSRRAGVSHERLMERAVTGVLLATQPEGTV